MIGRFFLKLLGPFVVLAMFASSAFAQGGRAELSGVVLDQGKAVLPGVTITVTLEGTVNPGRR